MHPTGQTGAQFACMEAKTKWTFQMMLPATKQSLFYTMQAKHAPFFSHPAWKQDVKKILDCGAEVKNF